MIDQRLPSPYVGFAPVLGVRGEVTGLGLEVGVGLGWWAKEGHGNMCL